MAPIITMPQGNLLQAQPSHGQPSSGPVVEYCETCPAKFTGDNAKNSKRKHCEQHSPFHYQCRLVSADGSRCGKLIDWATNRRRHVDKFHKSEAELLPTENPKRNQVPFLNEWFEKVQKSDK